MTGAGRIDVHHHLVPRAYRRWLGGRGLTAGGLPIPSWSTAAALAVMDDQRVATAVVSVSAPGVEGAERDDARRMARLVNEEAAALRRDRPDRFGFFATLPLGDPDGALEEVRHALDDLAADGVVLLTSHRGRYLGHPAFRPVLDELERRRAVVLVHPTEARAGDGTDPVDDVPAYAVDFLLETTRCALSLARTGVLDRQRVRIILSHAGGFLPYAAYRVALFTGRSPLAAAPALGTAPATGTAPSFRGVERLRRFYVEVALSAAPATLPSLLAFAAPGHVLFGSDFPYAPAEIGAAFTALLDAYDLPAGTRRSLDRGAAEALFPRLAGATPSPAGTGPGGATGGRGRWRRR